MQTIQEPDVLQQPFCESGDKNTIPSTATGSQFASLAEGFPEVTQKPVTQGGIPPERKDFNGAFNLLSKYNYAIQNGWLPTFKQEVSTAIGGYAEGACLWYMPTDGTYAGQVLMLKSLVANNTYDFTANPDIYIGTYWQIVTSAGGGGGLPLLTPIWSDHLLNDASYLRSDTFSWQSGNVYLSAYQHLVDDYNNCTKLHIWVNNGVYYWTTSTSPSVGDDVYGGSPRAVVGTVQAVSNNTITYNNTVYTLDTTYTYGFQEQIAGTTITFYRATDGHKVVLANQESNVATIFEATGIAWFYVLDTANQRFKLPRNIYGFTGYRGDVGGYVAESLPNITGSVANNAAALARLDGAFYQTTGQAAANGLAGSGSLTSTLGFDASRSSSAYQNNAPVQQRATQAYLYFYVGNTVQNETSVDVAEMTEALNDKSDKDLGNLNSRGKQVASTMSMPSGQYDTLTLGAQGTPYTAPADGYFTIAAMNTVRDGFLAFRNTTSSLYSASARNGFAGGEIQTFIMAKKGDSVVVLYDGLTDVIFRFVYAEGYKTN